MQNDASGSEKERLCCGESTATGTGHCTDWASAVLRSGTRVKLVARPPRARTTAPVIIGPFFTHRWRTMLCEHPLPPRITSLSTGDTNKHSQARGELLISMLRRHKSKHKGPTETHQTQRVDRLFASADNGLRASRDAPAAHSHYY